MSDERSQGYESYRTYLTCHEEYRRMHQKIVTDHNIQPDVAAYALFSTQFASIDAAMDFIFEVRGAEDGAGPEGMMQHSFIPYLPELAETVEDAFEEHKKSAGAAYLN